MAQVFRAHKNKLLRPNRNFSCPDYEGAQHATSGRSFSAAVFGLEDDALSMIIVVGCCIFALSKMKLPLFLTGNAGQFQQTKPREKLRSAIKSFTIKKNAV